MRILIALAILVTLALLASSKKLWSWRRSPIGAMLTTGGWLAVGVGVIIGPHGLEIVDEAHVETLRPLVLFCLGWVGLMVGLQMRRDLPKMLPPQPKRLAVVDFVLSILMVPGVTLAIIWINQAHGDRLAAAMVAGLFGACAIGWSAEVRSITVGHPERSAVANLLRATSGLSSILAVVLYGMLFMTVDHRSESMMMHLSFPHLAVGLLVSAVVAAVVGGLGFYLVKLAGRSPSEFLVVLLGTVTFIAGAAGTLGYSPLFVAMLCGVVIVNLPGELLQRFQRVIIDAEQPVAMTLMLVAGVLADPVLSQLGWVLVIALFVARFLVKVGVSGRAINRIADSHSADMVRTGPLRQAPLAIALITGFAISAHHLLTDSVLPAGQLVTIVILVGLISEAFPLVIRLVVRSPDDRSAAEADTVVQTEQGT